MTQLAETTGIGLLEREISRFITAASRTSDYTLYRNRRASARVHRTMPILFMRMDHGPQTDQCATLHNVSNDGLAFYCDCGLNVGAVIAVKLFWSDHEARRIPAIVRHCEITQQGFLIGAEFALHHHQVRELVEAHGAAWYG